MVSRTTWSTSKRALVWTFAGVLVVVLALLAWVGYRGLEARSELQKAAPLAAEVETAIVAGNAPHAKIISAELTAHANRAAGLTSDPVWRILEGIPWLGTNLTAVRESAAVADTIATHVVAPLTGIAAQLNTSTFKPVNGVENVTAIEAVAPVLSSARRALDQAQTDVQAISTDGTLQPVSAGVEQLRSSTLRADTVVDAISNAAKLLPAMLGADGPRNYLLLVQNPAELRATGGLAGAMAIIHTDDGHISLAGQASTAAFRTFPVPVETLPLETEGLYGEEPAEHIQEINLAPQFELAGRLASAMWTKRFGTPVDGVIAVDPTVLGYVLNATGAVKLEHGVVLDSSNAVSVLLSRVYSLYPDNASQDAFFAEAAGTIFTRVSHGEVNATGLLQALIKGGSQRRILIWSAHPSEQAVLAPTSLAGGLPASTIFKAGVGVYLNDTTGAKMDYYLKVTSSLASRICRSDGHPNARVTVTLTNTAPSDAASALPKRVTGADDFGVAPGSVRTKVSVYGPIGSLLVATTSAGADFAHHAATDSGRAVSQFEVELAPGQSKTVRVDFLDLKQFATAGYIHMTPGVDTHVASSIAPACTGS